MEELVLRSLRAAQVVLEVHGQHRRQLEVLSILELFAKYLGDYVLEAGALLLLTIQELVHLRQGRCDVRTLGLSEQVFISLTASKILIENYSHAVLSQADIRGPFRIFMFKAFFPAFFRVIYP